MKMKRRAALKNGEEILLRSLAPADAEDLLCLLRKTAGETRNMSRGADEWHVTTEKEMEILRACEMSAKEMMLGAFAGSRLIGVCQSRLISDADRVRHRAGLGIAVAKAHWNKGVGTALLGAMIGALKTTNLEQIELSVADTNGAAVSLYRRFGFVQYGCLTHAMKYRDGSYADMLLMKLDLRTQ